jgi:DNA-binding SARP family transcriptional activator/TolB-like protein/Tfp pilus assembly protein PilF
MGEAPVMRLSLLGGFELVGPDGRIDVGSRKACALVAYLAFNRGKPQSRETLATLLWGSQADAQARQNLRQALTTLRRELGDVLVARDDTVAIKPEALTCDGQEFEALCADGTLDALTKAADLYKGPFASGLSIKENGWIEWVAGVRTRLDQLAAKAMTRVGEHQLAQGQPDHALTLGERALALDGFGEDSHRLVIGSLAASRRRTDALRHYERLVDLLRRELGVDPEPATRSLVGQLRDGQLATGHGAATIVGAHHASSLDDGSALSLASPVTTRPDAMAQLAVDPASPALLSVSPGRSGADARSTDGGTHQAGTTGMAQGFAAASRLLARTAMGLRVPRLVWPLACGLLLTGAVVAVVREVFVARPAAYETAGLPRPDVYSIPIAVLPLVAVPSGDAALSAIAEHMSEDLTNLLSRISVLQVASRETVGQQWVARAPNVAALGAKLGVRYLLSGSIAALDEKLNVNVALIDARTGAHVWSRQYSEDRGQWRSVQEEVARRTTFAVHYELLRLVGNEPVEPGKEPTASQLAASGWAAVIGSSDSPSFPHAKVAFSEALRREPEFSSAMLGLAAYYLVAISNLKIPREPYLTEAEDLLRRLLAKSTNHHGVHYQFGILHNIQGNLPAALQAFDRSIEINPSHAPAYARKGRILIRLQRYEEALQNIRYALRLNGVALVPGWYMWAGLAELELGHDESARQLFQTAVASLPQNPYMRASLAALHALSGEWDEARRNITLLRDRTPQLSDEQRLVEFNKGLEGQALQNRLGTGLRLALEATGQPQ